MARNKCAATRARASTLGVFQARFTAPRLREFFSLFLGGETTTRDTWIFSFGYQLSSSTRSSRPYVLFLLFLLLYGCVFANFTFCARTHTQCVKCIRAHRQNRYVYVYKCAFMHPRYAAILEGAQNPVYSVRVLFERAIRILFTSTYSRLSCETHLRAKITLRHIQAAAVIVSVIVVLLDLSCRVSQERSVGVVIANCAKTWYHIKSN